MKRTSFVALAVSLLLSGGLVAQNKKQVKSDDYVRSSLYTIIVDDHGLASDVKQNQIIKETFFATPLPDKFNDHNLDTEFRAINLKDYPMTQEQADALLGKSGGKKENKFGKAFGKIAKETAGELTLGVVDTTNVSKIRAQFLEYFKDNQIADRIVGKWFNMDVQNNEDNSVFNFELVGERGLYSASQIDKNLAKGDIRGTAALQDAGVNLLPNTFVVGIRLNYLDKSEMADNLLGQSTILNDLAKGYIIKATAFLYQLDWNAEVENVFYDKYWDVANSQEFINSGLFSLKYIGSQTAWADVHSTSFSKVTQDELVQRATVRSIDKVIAKLQRKYDEFRTKAPLVTTTPELTAYIGTKEGVEAGDKYEVLEKSQDPQTGISTYKRIGVIKAEKGKIWDNTYAEELEEQTQASTLEATHFSGANKNMAPGMLIRQIN